MSIVGYWRMNGNSSDASGQANNGTDTDITYSQSNGKINQGAGFNGSTSKIILPYLNYSAGTVSIWVYFTSLAATFEIFCSNQNTLNSGNFFVIGSNAALGVGTIWVYDEALTKYSYTAPANATLNKWYHYVFTQTGTAIKIYRDGVSQALTTDGSTQSQWFANAGRNKVIFGMIERSSQQYYKLSGNLDDVIIDNTAWSVAKIKNEYSRVKGFF